MKSLAIGIASFVWWMSTSFGIDSYQSTQFSDNEPIKEDVSSTVQVSSSMLDKNGVSIFENPIPVKEIFSANDVYDAAAKKIKVELFHKKLSTLIAYPCELEMNFSKEFYSGKLLIYICNHVRFFPLRNNITSLVVRFVNYHPNSKDLAALKAMLSTLPSLKRLEIEGFDFPPGQVLRIFNCAKHLEQARFNFDFNQFRMTDTYMDSLKLFVSRHQSLKKINIENLPELFPQEVVLLMGSMPLESIVFQLNLSNCSEEDVLAIEHKNVSFMVKSVYVFVRELNAADGVLKNAERFLLAFAAKLKAVEVLDLAYHPIYGDVIDGVIPKFLNLIQFPELLNSLTIYMHFSSMYFDDGVLNRFKNLNRLLLTRVEFPLPTYPKLKLTDITMLDCKWSGSFAESFPNLENINLRESNVAFSNISNYVTDMFRWESIKNLRVQVSPDNYLLILNAFSTVNIKGIKFTGKLAIGFEPGDYMIISESSNKSFVCATIDALTAFGNASVHLDFHAIIINADEFEQMILNIPNEKSIYIGYLRCDRPITLEKNGEVPLFEMFLDDNENYPYLYRNLYYTN